jgi:hypothetical protein
MSWRTGATRKSQALEFGTPSRADDPPEDDHVAGTKSELTAGRTEKPTEDTHGMTSVAFLAGVIAGMGRRAARSVIAFLSLVTGIGLGSVPRWTRAHARPRGFPGVAVRERRGHGARRAVRPGSRAEPTDEATTEPATRGGTGV